MVGIVGESLDSANLTENCVKLINIKGIDRDYLYYYLVSQFGQNEIKKGTVGAVQPKLPIKNIQSISINYPININEQKKIALILSKIDEKIELNNKINNNLEQQAMLLFKSWFIDYEPWGLIKPSTWKDGVLSDFVDIKRGGSPRPIQDYLAECLVIISTFTI